MIISLITIFISTTIATFFVRKIALQRKILDIPNSRSSHVKPTPRGGGIAVAVIWFCTIIILFIQNKISESFFLALLCGLPISLVGFLDDIYTISPKIRFIIQILCAASAVYLIGGLFSIDIGVTKIFSSYIFSLIAVIGIVWFTNLFNFLDGIDGYISSEVIFVCVSLYLLNGIKFPLFLAASVGGFLIWNWQPAKIFMGDVGSTLLGFTLGIFTFYFQNLGQSSIVPCLMLTSAFWFDATITLIRRIRNKENISKPHNKHIYQRIVQSGFSHQKTVITLIIINVFVFFLTLLAIRYKSYSIFFLSLNILLLYQLLRIVDKKMPFKKN